MKYYILILSIMAITFKVSSQIVVHSGNNYDSSIVIKTAEYWDDIYKICQTSTFIMQKGCMQEVYSDGGMFGCPLLDTCVAFTLGEYDYKIWSTGGAVIYILMRSHATNKYWFRRLFSSKEEIFEVVSVESKIDKVFQIGVGIR